MKGKGWVFLFCLFNFVFVYFGLVLVCLNVCSEASCGKGKIDCFMLYKAQSTWVCKWDLFFAPAVVPKMLLAVWPVWGEDAWWDHDHKCSIHKMSGNCESEESSWFQSQRCEVEWKNPKHHPRLHLHLEFTVHCGGIGPRLPILRKLYSYRVWKDRDESGILNRGGGESFWTTYQTCSSYKNSKLHTHQTPCCAAIVRRRKGVPTAGPFVLTCS